MFVILALATIPMLWYGTKLLSTNLELQISLSQSLRIFPYAWQSQQSLGTSLMAQGWLFPVGTFYALCSIVNIPGYIAVRLWYIGILFLAGATMYFYASSLLRKLSIDSYGNKRASPDELAAGSLIAAIAYIANPFVVASYDNGHFLNLYAILPLQLLFLEKGLATGKIYYAACMGLLSLFVTTNIPIVIINYLVLFIYIIFHCLIIERNFDRKKAVFLLTTLVITLLNLLWYFLPMLLVFLRNDSTLSSAIMQESWQMYGKHSSFSETFRLLGTWPIYGAYKFGPYYVNNGLVIVITYLIPLLAISGIVISQRNRIITFFLILLAVSLFMAVGGHSSSPLKGVYVYFYDHIPLFPMFRNGYKFVGIIAFVYAILISMTLLFLLQHEWVRAKKLFIPICLSFATIFIFSAQPLYSGRIFNNNSLVEEVPMYWRDAADWLDSKKDDFRVLLLPDQYFDTYRWGAWSSFYSSVPYLKHDTIFNSATKDGNEIIQMLYSPLSSSRETATHKFQGNIGNDDFCNILKVMGIQYIIQRDDIDWSVYKVSPPENVKLFLKNLSCVEFSRNFGEAYIYRVIPDVFPKFYTLAMATALAEPTDVANLPAMLSTIINEHTTTDIFPQGVSEDSGSLRRHMKTAKENKLINIEFHRIDPTKYRVRIHNVTNNFHLIFNERFDPYWRAYIVPTHHNEESDDQFVSINHYGSTQNDNLPDANFWETWLPYTFQPTDFAIKSAKNTGTYSRAIEWPSTFHSKAFAFANSWVFDLELLRRQPKTDSKQSGYYILNLDDSIDFEIVIEYLPQRFLYLGYAISAFSTLLCLGFISYMFSKRKRSNA